jgi:hypothetical protein
MAQKAEPLVPSDPLVERKAEVRRLAEAESHAAQAQRLFDRKNYDQAARQLALSYVFDARPERLRALAEACRRADLDLEALAIYQRLEREPAPEVSSAAVTEAVTTLVAKLEDTDIAVPRALRGHLDQGRQQFQEGVFLRAAEEYALTYAMKSLPRLLFNIAQAYCRAGRMDEAYVLYGRFLREERQTPLRKEAVGYLEELRPVAFRPPLYKRAWFWGVLGAAAVTVAAGAAGLAVGLRQNYPQTDVGPNVITFGLRN